MKLFQKMKGKLGFTLAELLVVIALLAIAMAVAVPNTAAYVKRIKLTELDDSARSIYMAAQSKLDSLKSQGKTLSGGANVIGVALERYSADPNKIFYTSKSTTVDDSTGGFMNLSSNSGSVIESELDENDYIIEYDPETGIVYGVFYSESGELESKYVTNGPDAMKTEFSDRLGETPLIGYYGGKAYKAPVENNTDIPKPIVTPFNAEKMGVVISVPDGYSEAYYFTVSLTGKDVDGNTQTIDVATKSSGASFLGNHNNDVTIIFDTLKVDGNSSDAVSGDLTNKVVEKSFEEWANGKIALGSDITVKVEFYDPKGIAKSQTTTSSAINSLFADGSNETTAKVAYGRHLENLSKAPVTVNTVEIIDDIDFSDTSDNYEGWNNSKTYAGRYAFNAVNNTNIQTVYGNNHKISYVQINGSGLFNELKANVSRLEIYGAYVEGANVGVLAGTADADISYVKVVNSRVKGSQNAGGIVGVLNGGVITSSEVYVENCTAIFDAKNPGSTISSEFSSDVTKLSSDPHAKFTVSGTNNAGGIVGVANNGSKISSSYASVRVESTSGNAGGLIGSTSGTVNLEDVYSGGHTYRFAYEYDYNGTVGTLYNVKSESGIAGGIVGNTAGTVNVKGVVYSTCSVKGNANSDTAFGGTGSDPSVVEGAVCYSAGYNYSSATEVKTTSKRGNVLSSSEAKREHTAPKANTYDPEIKMAYPYEGLTIHRGDWVSEPETSDGIVGFFYWEVHGSGSDPVFVGYYYDSENDLKGELSGELCYKEDDTEVTKYGYGYFYTTEPENLSELKVDGTADNAVKASIKSTLERNYEGVMVVANVIDGAVGEGNKTFAANYSEGKALTVYYNPDFYTISDKETDYNNFGKDSFPYQVRTAAQLQHVGHNSYLNGFYFMQSHDIVGKGTHTPIGNASKPFTGTYDGQSYRIIKLKFSNAQYTGLFGVTHNARLMNIILFAPALGEGTEGDPYYNDPEYTVSVSGSNAYAGGIVGWAKFTPGATVSAQTNVPVIGLSSGTSAGMKVSSLGVSSGSARVMNAYNSLYAKTAALGASTGAKVRALANECVHEFDGYWGNNDSQHNAHCKKCNQTFWLDHDFEWKRFDWGHQQVCPCGKNLQGSHTMVNGRCTECGWPGDIPSACDHKYNGWQTDGEYHWHKCTSTCGNELDKAAHTPLAGTVKDIGNNMHEYTCSVCASRVRQTHTFDGTWIIDEAATPEKDGVRHRKCKYCTAKSDPEYYSYSNDTGNTCPNGHSNWYEWQVNGDEHSRRCRHCDYVQSGVHRGAKAGDSGKYYCDPVTHEESVTGHKHRCEICNEMYTAEPSGLKYDKSGGNGHKVWCVDCGHDFGTFAHYPSEDDCEKCVGSTKPGTTPDPSTPGGGDEGGDPPVDPTPTPGGDDGDDTPDDDTDPDKNDYNPSAPGIYNCAVAGYTFSDSASGEGYIGGIVGKSEVPVKYCEAVVDIVRTAVKNSGKTYYGGIAGLTSDTIANCYSGGLMKIGAHVADASFGGIAGGAAAKGVSDCYTYMQFNNTTSSQFTTVYAIAPDAGVGSGNKAVTGDGYFSAQTNVSSLSANRKSPRSYVNMRDIDNNNNTDYVYRPVIYDFKTPESTSKKYEHYGYWVTANKTQKGDLVRGPVAGIFNVYEYSDTTDYDTGKPLPSGRVDGLYSYNRSGIINVAEYISNKTSYYTNHIGIFFANPDFFKDELEEFKDDMYIAYNDPRIKVYVGDELIPSSQIKPFLYTDGKPYKGEGGYYHFKSDDGTAEGLTDEFFAGHQPGVIVTTDDPDQTPAFLFYKLYDEYGKELTYEKDSDGNYPEIQIWYNNGKQEGILISAAGPRYEGNKVASSLDATVPPKVGVFMASTNDGGHMSDMPKYIYPYTAVANFGDGRGSIGQLGNNGRNQAWIGLLVEKGRVDDLISENLTVNICGAPAQLAPWDECVGVDIANAEALGFGDYELFVVTNNISVARNDGLNTSMHAIAVQYGSKELLHFTYSDLRNATPVSFKYMPNLGLGAVYGNSGSYYVEGYVTEYNGRYGTYPPQKSGMTNGSAKTNRYVVFIDKNRKTELDQISVTINGQPATIGSEVNMTNIDWNFYGYTTFWIDSVEEIKPEHEICVKYKGETILKYKPGDFS